MSTLIPEIPLSEFKKLKAHELKRLKSCEVTSDGQYLFTVIIPPSRGGMSIVDRLKTEAEYLAVSSNTIGGEDLEQITEKMVRV